MNDLLEQFLVECRELVEAATGDLLALETSPQDQERVDGAFRGFHTLKGAAGIVGFSAMSQVLHAAESLLNSIRTGNRPVSGELIGDCLACLDQVVRWLEEVEAKGDIPVLPDTAADALVARLTPSDPAPSRVGEPMPARELEISDAPDWLALLLARHASHRTEARTALRYAPDADCFFRGEDPLALIAGLPGMLALDLAPAEPWPAPQEFNPFECNLVITALLASSPDVAASVLRPVAGQVAICPVVEIRATDARLSTNARAILEEQLLLAANDEAAGFVGRLGSAARVAVNVLNHVGWSEACQTLSDAMARSLHDGSGAAFIGALRPLLAQMAQEPTGEPASNAAQALPEKISDAGQLPDRVDDPAPRTQVVRVLRVDAERIDALVNLTGELTVVKNAIGHTVRLARDGADPDDLLPRLKDQHALLDRLVGQLQRSVLGVRVLPLHHVFQHFPRLVREMAQELRKSVRLVVEGQATEADKATVEALFEPLLHVLRNALDHGVEPAQERLAAGKPPSATVQLRATRDGDQVVVEVTDDGRGIDVAAIRRKAARLGLVSEAALAETSDQAVTELIFSPGFSTADAVTPVSGRGVGMDAVRAAVLRLGGRVTVSSKPGVGTNVRITLPFTVMMLRVMTVDAGGQTFGIPIEAVVETTRVPRGCILRVGAAEVVVLRERTVPLIRLTEVLGLAASDAGADADARIVVVSVSGQGRDAAEPTGAPEVAALEVDSPGERIDVMLKPMDGLLASVNGFAGTALLGDGRVLIVLDLEALLR
jgi:two-component system, chemotaxis family, sensor kinase CheA